MKQGQVGTAGSLWLQVVESERGWMLRWVVAEGEEGVKDFLV